jgi:integral membrane protein (TIGR01906 family)
LNTDWFSRSIHIALEWILALTVPIILIIMNVRLIMLPVVITLEYSRPGFPSDPYGFSTQDRLEFGMMGIQYLIDNLPIAYLQDLQLPGSLCYPPQESPCSAFNPRELMHMVDVQIVINAVFRSVPVLITIWVIGLALKRWFVRSVSLRSSLKYGSLLTVAAIIAIILIAMVAWDHFFAQFHQLFFADGTWQFYYSDTLIRLYPQQFWFDAALAIGILTLSEALMILGLDWYRVRRKL